MFYIHTKAQHYFEFYLPLGFQVTLPQNLARALGYLNHQNRVPAIYEINVPTPVQLNKDENVTLRTTTRTVRRKDELVWGMLSRHSFHPMYIYPYLIESLAVGDVHANLLRMILPRSHPSKMVVEEIKRPTYHRVRTSTFFFWSRSM